MKTYMVGYDLNRPAQNYTALIDALKQYSNWWHHLDSTWLIKTNNPAAQIRDHLRTFIDANDELLIAYISGESAWAGFNDEGSRWLNDNIVPN